MNHPARIFVRLVSPIVVALLLTGLAVIGPTFRIETLIPIWEPLIFVSQPLDNPTVSRVVLATLATLSFAYPAFRNYSNFFPTYMKFTVYFDLAGIEKTLNAFSLRERATELQIANDWREYHGCYLQKINKMIRDPQFQNALHPVPESVRLTEDIHGEGEFAYRIVPTRGFQSYQLDQAWGYVRYQFPADNRRAELLTVFHLHDTHEARFKASLVDIYLRYTKVVRPRMGQFTPTSPFHLRFVDDVLAATKIRIFPIPSLGNTLYLVDRALVSDAMIGDESKRAGWMIPVAYGVYEFD